MPRLPKFGPLFASLALHGGVFGAVASLNRATSESRQRTDHWAGAPFLLSVELEVPPEDQPLPASPPAPPVTHQASPQRAAPALQAPNRSTSERTRAHSAPHSPSPREPSAPLNDSPGTGTDIDSNPAATVSAATAFGGEDLPPGVRSLASAVTRALPMAAERDPVWFDLPLGDLGEIRIEFVTVDDGGLQSSKVLELPSPSPALKQVLERTFLFLKNGKFAVDPTHLGAGTQTIKIHARLLQRAGNDNELAEPQHTFVLHQEAPTHSKPGLAYVTFNSGRQIEFVIELE